MVEPFGRMVENIWSSFAVHTVLNFMHHINISDYNQHYILFVSNWYRIAAEIVFSPQETESERVATRLTYVFENRANAKSLPETSDR